MPTEREDDDEDEEDFENEGTQSVIVERSSSFEGMPFLRKKWWSSAGGRNKEIISRERAHEMSVLYELNNLDPGLNKHPTFKPTAAARSSTSTTRCAPRLYVGVSAQQAVVEYQKSKAEWLESESSDPLRTDLEWHSEKSMISPSASSVARTEAETPSPKAYIASNGKVYRVPNFV